MSQIIIIEKTVTTLPELKSDEKRYIIASHDAMIPVNIIMDIQSNKNTYIKVIDFKPANLLYEIFKIVNTEDEYVIVSENKMICDIFYPDTTLDNKSHITIWQTETPKHKTGNTKKPRTTKKTEGTEKTKSDKITVMKPVSENDTNSDTDSADDNVSTDPDSDTNLDIENPDSKVSWKYNKITDKKIKTAIDEAIEKAGKSESMLLFHLKMKLAPFGYLAKDCEELQQDILKENAM